MLICRRIPAVSAVGRKLLRLENAVERGGTGNTLWKMSSEPSLPFESESSLLYRTEEVEIIAKPVWADFDCGEWQIFSQPVTSHSPHVSFVAFLGVAAASNGGGIELADALLNESALTFNSSEINPANQPAPVHVDRLCRKLGHRRGRPWEVLYDCELEEFCNIAFAWSENALFDVDGKASVKGIQTVHLPESLLSKPYESNDLQRPFSVAGRGSSLSSLNVSQQPLTLLEILHLNDSEEDIASRSVAFSLLSSTHRCSTKFRSDTALHVDHPPQPFYKLPRPVGSSKRASRTRNISLCSSFRYRACSPVPDSVFSYSQELVPAFIRYLEKTSKFSIFPAQSRSVSTSTNISPSTTFGDTDELDDRLNACVSSSEEKKTENSIKVDTGREDTTESPIVQTGSRSSKSASSRFTTSLVNEQDIHPPLKPPRQRSGNILEESGSDEPKSEELVVSLKVVPPPSSTIEQRSSVVKFTSRMSAVPSEPIARSGRHPLREYPPVKTVAVNSAVLQHNDVCRTFGNLEITRRRRHSSMMPRLFDDLYPEEFVKTARRRSLSPMALQHSTIPLDRPSMFTAESFRRQMSTPTRRRLHSVAPSDKAQAKPPTILVYTGDNDALYERIENALSTMISPDTYAVFHLSCVALRNHPWINREAACLMLADTQTLDDESWSRLQDYFNHSGKMLFICQNNLLASLSSCGSSRKSSKMLKMAFGERQTNTLGKDFENFLKKMLKMISKNKKVNETFHAKDLVGGYKYSVVISKTEDTPLLLYMENAKHQASALFSDATCEELLSGGAPLIADALSRLSIETLKNVHPPDLTRGFLICETDRLPWQMQGMRFNENFGTNPKFLIRQIKKHGELPEPSRELIPLEVRTRDEGVKLFDDKLYFRTLKTKGVGKAVIFVPVCESTQDLARSLAAPMPGEPIVVVARQQTKGKGRSGNQWLSPIGCAMFSFNYEVPQHTALADNVGFIQHIFCVAVVDGIRSLYDFENFPLKIKWPNDIYYGRTHKMGGMLVNVTTCGEKVVCTIGTGLNVTNSKPTVCVNDVLPADSGVEITVEEVIASSLNKFEHYVEVFQTGGRQAFLKHYYDFWLHSREEVTLSKTGERVMIRGLDEHGFLEVRSRQSGRVLAVHPDGNTFDMMKGLISVKY